VHYVNFRQFKQYRGIKNGECSEYFEDFPEEKARYTPKAKARDSKNHLAANIVKSGFSKG